MRMQINIDKKRWLYRQSFLVQWIVFAATLFLASIFANMVADCWFDGTFIFRKTGKEIESFLLSKFSKALIFGVMITFLIQYNQKKIEPKKE